MKSRQTRLGVARERQGPGYLFLVIALAAVALVSARFMGVSPAGILEQVSSRFSTPVAGDMDPLDVSQRGEPAAPVARAEPRVLIYHAHASENYAPKSTHARPGAAGDVVEVGKELAASLEAKGIRTIHLTGVYDENWQEAYPKSAEAARQVLEANPSIELVLDIHRDAVESRQAGIGTRQVGDERTARILFVSSERDNPNIHSNAEMASRLKEELDRQYPGLSRGMRMFQHLSNGHVHPNAVEVHLGDHYDSTLDEAKAAARRLADVIEAVLD